MKVLHLASSNRWTGAAAPAFAEVQSLRQSGIEAHYAYVGGYKLEAKLREVEYAHPFILKRQDPLSFYETVRAVRALVARHGIDIVHAHLTYDHLVAASCRSAGVRIFRTFHSRRTLRRDPFTRMLMRRTDGVAVVNATYVDTPLLRGRNAVFTPPPLDSEQFSPEGTNARGTYALDADVPVVGMIGKVAPERGFEEGLHTFAELRRMMPRVRLLIIGHGPQRPLLEELARSLSIDDAVIWAGYHEDDLAEHFRAMDAFLFTRTGSDEGHRAVLEAMGCGVPVVSAPIAGVDALLGTMSERLLAKSDSPRELAELLLALLSSALAPFRDAARQQALRFSYAAAATRLLALYEP